MRRRLSSACLLLLGTTFAPLTFAQEVVGAGKTFSVVCRPNTENERLRRLAQREAVIDAESQCSWYDGRPSVRRISDWRVRVSCNLAIGNQDYGDAEASARFTCIVAE